MATTLGLDLGPNSIGWALIKDDGNEGGSRLIDIGVRVFPEGVDAFDTAKEKSRNEARRLARSMRRQTRRRAARRRKLKAALIEWGLYPAGESDQDALNQLDPYELRARGATEGAAPLTPHEIGRALLHLNERRGFLSIRKKDATDKDLKGILKEMGDLQDALQGRTLGQFLYEKAIAQEPTARTQDDYVRGRHTRRIMIEDEFDRIWTVQAKHHPGLLTDDRRDGKLGRRKYPAKPVPRPKGMTALEAFGIHGLMFFHRKLYWPKSMIGLCEFEPKQYRCAIADRRAQRFRILQEVNNLKYIDPDDNVEKRLDEGQRKLVVEKLSAKREMTFDQIRKALGFTDSVRFNLEKGKRPKLKGHVVDTELAKKAGQAWKTISEDDKNALVAMLADPARDDDELAGVIGDRFNLDEDTVEQILVADLPAGYTSVSLMAIKKLMPHLEAGLIMMANDVNDSALHAAGYLRRDQLQLRVFDKLPDLQRVSLADCKLGDLPNPVVKRALVELRKVVNGIIGKHKRRPDAIHVEMARELQQGEKARKEFTSRMREREKMRDDAANHLRENGVRVNRSAILRYLLWEEQSHECVYTGVPITFAQLFNGETDIDHILPYSRTLDDAQANKVVCFRGANAEKGNKTPYEWLASDRPAEYEKLCQRVTGLQRTGKMAYSKSKRFYQKEVEVDDFIARQLVDTAYLSRATVEYLKCLFDSDERKRTVLGLKGKLTAELRHQWGLGSTLSELEDSPAWAADKDLPAGQKNRADHRHHAIDALVVALTNRSRLAQLTRIKKEGGVRTTGEALEFPWENFRDEVQDRIGKILVSHRSERKVSGRLHEDTVYGAINDDKGQAVEGRFKVRKEVAGLTASEVMAIRDEVIQKCVLESLHQEGLIAGKTSKGRGRPKIEYLDQSTGKGVKDNDERVQRALSGVKMPSGVPVKRVRLERVEGTIQPIRQEKGQPAYVKPGNTHHLCLFEIVGSGKTKREVVFVTMLEAMDRLKRQQRMFEKLRKDQEDKTGQKIKKCDAVYKRFQKQAAEAHPIICRDHPKWANAKFLFSLSKGEMVMAETKIGPRLLIYKTSASTQGQLYFTGHTDARRSSDQEKVVFMANTLKAFKVQIDPIGRLRKSRD